MSVQRTYNELQSIDSILRKEIISQYESGAISYYQVNDAIASYSDFLYYSEKTFDYINSYEKDSRSKEVQNAITSAYTNMRYSYYNLRNTLQ